MSRAKPMEQHELEGTQSEVGVKRKPGTNQRVKRQVTHTTHVAGRVELKPPVGFSAAELGAWRELAAQLAAILDGADASMLELAAVQLARFRAARELVHRDGLLVLNRFDQWAENPALKVERDAGVALHRACLELGIGPSARARFSGIGADGLQAAAALEGVADLVAIRGGAA